MSQPTIFQSYHEDFLSSWVEPVLIRGHLKYLAQGYNAVHPVSLKPETIWASTRENRSSVVCEKQRRRPACASAQSDQRLCFSLIEKYDI